MSLISNKNTVNNLLSSGFVFKDYERLFRYRVEFFNVLVISISTLVFVMALYRFVNEQFINGMVDLLIPVFNLLLLFYLRSSKSNYYRAALGVIVLSFSMLVVLTFIVQNVMILAWFIVVLMIAFILGGIPFGIGILSAIIFYSIIGIFFFLHHTIFVSSDLVTLTIIAVAISMIAYFYDSRMQKDNIELMDINDFLAEKVEERTKELELAKNKIEDIYQNIQESIEYAAMIQQAIIPKTAIIKNHYSDFFIIWEPRDTVGGDIYFYNELNEYESILLVLDCTGHGVAGAFVTMLTKAIERQIMNEIQKGMEPSPSKILRIFNKSIKQLLRPDNPHSILNTGFDGGVLYYNKKEHYIRYSGANISLFIMQNGILKIIKANRFSIGYKRSDENYMLSEHRIDVDNTTTLYLSSDGYIDQKGGEKGFSFGKENFKKLLEEHHDKNLIEQKNALINALKHYQGDWKRVDDMMVIGLKI